jgi:hypothetical protein
VRILDATTAARQKVISIWSRDQSRKALGDPSKIDPPKLRDLMAAMDAAITKAEPELASYTPIAACAGTDTVFPDTDGDGEPDMPEVWHRWCNGHEIWTCGDIVVRYPTNTPGTTLRDKLTVEVGGKRLTVGTKGWRKPKLKETMNGEKTGTLIDVMNCAHDVRRIPGTKELLVELSHACDISGDWCSAGGPTWEVVTAP